MKVTQWFSKFDGMPVHRGIYQVRHIVTNEVVLSRWNGKHFKAVNPDDIGCSCDRWRGLAEKPKSK